MSWNMLNVPWCDMVAMCTNNNNKKQTNRTLRGIRGLFCTKIILGIGLRVGFPD